MFASIIFWISLFLLCYTYLLYPILVQLLAIGKQYTPPSESPSQRVFIIIAAHNEESVIIEKLRSIEANDYPTEKVHLYIGSDNSTDKTNLLVENYRLRSKYPIHFFIMPTRSGKVGTVNFLAEQIRKEHNVTEEDIFISTDANVLFSPRTISTLSRHFIDKSIGIVDSHITNTKVESYEISRSESNYLNRETRLKHREGLIFGKLMGAFGGCFAIRANCFVSIPNQLRVDDFFLTMKTMIKGYQAISDPEAVCYEEAGSGFKEEFKRKRRISSGNFQNLSIFKKYLLPTNTLSFVFFSHKVLRYIGPLLMIFIFLSSLYLATKGNWLMQLFLLAQLTWYIAIPVLDKLLQQLGINVLALRHVRYFNYMNLALLLGLKDYLNGIDSNIWEPTKRNTIE